MLRRKSRKCLILKYKEGLIQITVVKEVEFQPKLEQGIGIGQVKKIRDYLQQRIYYSEGCGVGKKDWAIGKNSGGDPCC